MICLQQSSDRSLARAICIAVDPQDRLNGKVIYAVAKLSWKFKEPEVNVTWI